MQKSYDERVSEKFDPEIDLCHGEFEKPGVINTSMAVHNWDFTYYMSEQELKEYKGEMPKKLVPPKMFDLSKADRVVVTKEDLK